MIRDPVEAYDLAGWTFRIDTDLPERASHLGRLLAQFRSDRTTVDHVYELRSIPKDARGAAFELLRDGNSIQRAVDPRAMSDWVLGDVVREAIDGMRDRMLVHAAAAVVSGRGLLLPGQPDAGKSTLVAGLVRAGASYLSDEAAILASTGRGIDALPKALWLDLRSVEAVGLLGELPADARGLDDDRWHVHPDDLRPGSIEWTARVDVIVLPRYEPGAGVRMAEISPARALATLAECTFDFPRHGATALHRLVELVDSVRCYELVNDDLAGAVAAILRVMGPATTT